MGGDQMELDPELPTPLFLEVGGILKGYSDALNKHTSAQTCKEPSRADTGTHTRAVADFRDDQMTRVPMAA